MRKKLYSRIGGAETDSGPFGHKEDPPLQLVSKFMLTVMLTASAYLCQKFKFQMSKSQCFKTPSGKKLDTHTLHRMYECKSQTTKSVHPTSTQTGTVQPKRKCQRKRRRIRQRRKKTKRDKKWKWNWTKMMKVM